MKYIRTKDGKIIKILKEGIDMFGKYGMVNKENCIRNYDDSKQADTIEELCDEFVVFIKGSCGGHWLTPIKDFEHTKKEYCYDEIYGAIWTNKGLIYVAKMNKKGDLELL